MKWYIIYILIGILLYILSNNIDGLSIGGLSRGQSCPLVVQSPDSTNTICNDGRGDCIDCICTTISKKFGDRLDDSVESVDFITHGLCKSVRSGDYISQDDPFMNMNYYSSLTDEQQLNLITINKIVGGPSIQDYFQTDNLLFFEISITPRDIQTLTENEFDQEFIARFNRVKNPEHCNWGELNDVQQDILESIGWMVTSWDEDNDAPFNNTVTPRQIQRLNENKFMQPFIASFRNRWNPEDCDWDELNTRQQDALARLGWNKISWTAQDVTPYHRSVLDAAKQSELRDLGFSQVFINDFKSGVDGGAAHSNVCGTSVPGTSVPEGVPSESNTETINMLANTLEEIRPDQQCQPDTDQCNVNTVLITSDSDNTRDELYKFCGNLPDSIQKKCFDYHSLDYLCHQSCPVTILPFDPIDPSNPDPDPTKLHMENAGVEFIQGVMPSDHSDADYAIYLRFLTILEDGANIYGYNNDIDLYFGEYMYIKYLQKLHPGKKLLRIKFGIFYLDNMLYIFITDRVILRSDIRQDLIVGELSQQILINTLRTGGRRQFRLLHADLPTSDFEPADYLPSEIDTAGNRGLFGSDIRYSNVANNYHFNNSAQRVNNPVENIEKVLYLVHKLVPTLNENRDSLKYFNIWLKIDGPPEAKTLGFVDIVDPSFNKDTVLRDMSRDNENPNITLINKNKVASQLNINKVPEEANKVLYTPNNMNNGDILRFDSTSTPHTALNQDGNNWRLSAETRYAVLKVDFNLSSEYSIEGEELQIHYAPDTIAKLNTHEMLTIVNTYFQEQFSSATPKPTSIQEFLEFLESIPSPY